MRWYEIEAEPENWKNPISKVKAPKLPEKILSPVSLQDVFALVDTYKSNIFIDRRDKCLLLFLVDTGIRALELINLNLHDVKLMTGEIIIQQGKDR